MAVLSNIDISNYANLLNLPLIGVFCKDELPPRAKNGFYVINMSNHDEDGSHWTSFGVHQGRCWYFDSFASPPPTPVEKFLAPFKPIIYNTKQIQKLLGEYCGWTTLLAGQFMFHPLHKNLTLEKRMEEFLSLFSEDQNRNEKIMELILSRLLSKKMKQSKIVRK